MQNTSWGEGAHLPLKGGKKKKNWKKKKRQQVRGAEKWPTNTHLDEKRAEKKNCEPLRKTVKEGRVGGV